MIFGMGHAMTKFTYECKKNQLPNNLVDLHDLYEDTIVFDYTQGGLKSAGKDNTGKNRNYGQWRHLDPNFRIMASGATRWRHWP